MMQFKKKFTGIIMALFGMACMAVPSMAASFAPIEIRIPVRCETGGKFAIEAESGSIAPEAGTITITEEQKTGDFVILCNEPDVYRYKISQMTDEDPDVTYDTTVYTVTASVFVDESKSPEELQYGLYLGREISGEKKIPEVVYNNTRRALPCIVDPPVYKELIGDKPASDSVFKFKMEAIRVPEGIDLKDAPMPEGSENGVKYTTIVGAGESEFGEFPISTPGTYVYRITEENTGVAGYTYDNTVYEISFFVERVGNRLVPIQAITKNGVAAEKDVFINKYTKPRTNNVSGGYSGGGGPGPSGPGTQPTQPAPTEPSVQPSPQPQEPQQTSNIPFIGNIPKTGEAVSIFAILAVMAASGGALLYMKKKKDNEKA